MALVALSLSPRQNRLARQMRAGTVPSGNPSIGSKQSWIVTACSAHASFGGLDDPITAAELIAALKQLPRHKAADACGFRSEHIALILEGYERDALPLLPAVTAWVHAFNHIFGTSEVPQEWCRQVIIALHKGREQGHELPCDHGHEPYPCGDGSHHS